MGNCRRHRRCHSLQAVLQSKPVPPSTSTAPKHVEQTAVHAFREPFPAQRGTYSKQQLLRAAYYTEAVKLNYGFTNTLKQAPLTRKVKEGFEIPKFYRDAGNFTNPQWHVAEKKEMRGVLESESWQEIEQSLVAADMRKKALRAHHIYGIIRSTDAKTASSSTDDDSTKVRIQKRTVQQSHKRCSGYTSL